MMPTLSELRDAAKTLAATAGRDCSPGYLFWLCDNAARRPHDWGFPQSYSRRPNWTADLLREEVSFALWRRPTHPARIARAFSRLPFDTLSKIANGSIESLWPTAPSKAIRHEWLAACSANRQFGGREWEEWLTSPLRWFTRHCPIGDYVPRSEAIAQWLVAKKTWKGWSRKLPVGYGPDGQMVTVPAVDLLDEIEDGDLVAGPTTSPERVFRAVLARKSEAELARIASLNAPFPEMPWAEIPGVTQIRYARDLVAEGHRMGHCVGSYADRCRRGDCYILRLPHSTAEILPNGSVYQHRSHRNSSPKESDKKLLAKWLADRKVKHNETPR
jgi:hypothetical protein